MRTKRLLVSVGIAMAITAVAAVRADVLEMQNGDRYSGTVLGVTADTVVLKSEVLGKINVPRGKVAALKFGSSTNEPVAKTAAAPIAPPLRPANTNQPIIITGTPLANTNADLAAAFQQLGADTNFVAQIRQQMFAGSPAGAAKYDEMVSGLLSGQISVGDLRKQALAAADQLRALKRDMPEAGESLDAYLQVLDGFLNETANQPASATPAPSSP
jgi:hypothetical protein